MKRSKCGNGAAKRFRQRCGVFLPKFPYRTQKPPDAPFLQQSFKAIPAEACPQTPLYLSLRDIPGTQATTNIQFLQAAWFQQLFD